MVIGIDASRAVTGQRTGTEAYAYYLIQSLIPLATERKLRLQLYFNETPPEGIFPQADHVEQVIIPLQRLWTHLRLGWQLSQKPPDVFFTPAHVIPYSYRGPAVATVHDLGFHHFPDAHTKGQVAYLRWSTNHNARRSQQVIADSQATKDDLIHFYQVDPKKIKVVYPGIDPELRPVRDPVRQAALQAKYNLRPPYLLYIGTLQPRKNLSRLIDAYIASGVSHQLVLAGKVGWLAQPILEKIDNIGRDIQNRILLPGYVADEDKAGLVSGADALLFPSLYEGFGFPVVEGNACGTPVMCSNSSSLPEIAGDAALLVDPLDQEAMATGIVRITGDEALRRRLIETGQANCQRFNWRVTADQVLYALQQVKN